MIMSHTLVSRIYKCVTFPIHFPMIHFPISLSYVVGVDGCSGVRNGEAKVKSPEGDQPTA